MSWAFVFVGLLDLFFVRDMYWGRFCFVWLFGKVIVGSELRVFSSLEVRGRGAIHIGKRGRGEGEESEQVCSVCVVLWMVSVLCFVYLHL